MVITFYVLFGKLFFICVKHEQTYNKTIISKLFQLKQSKKKMTRGFDTECSTKKVKKDMADKALMRISVG